METEKIKVNMENGNVMDVVVFSKRANLIEIVRSEEHTSELQSPDHLVCRLLLGAHV